MVEDWKENHTGENSPLYVDGNRATCRGSNWNEQRKKAINRDEVCQNCETEENLTVHHITPFREYGLENYEEANKLSNLVTLCRSCHTKEEHKT